MVPAGSPTIAAWGSDDEVAHGGGVPVVAARQAAGFVHALLHHGPLPVGGEHERMQIDLEAVVHGVVVDARREPAGAHERVAVEAEPIRELRSSSGVRRDWRPRPPQMKRPSSCARGLRPRLSALITDVVMPEECQSMPITDPRAWNQNGSLRRVRTASRP